MKNNLVILLVELKESFSEIFKSRLSSIKNDVNFVQINNYQEINKKCNTCDALVAEFSAYNSQFLDFFCFLRKIPIFMFIDKNGKKL